MLLLVGLLDQMKNRVLKVSLLFGVLLEFMRVEIARSNDLQHH